MLSKQKRTMLIAMRKQPVVTFKRFVARLTKINNYLFLLPESDDTNNMNKEELN